jgi:hypothetical protein
VNQVHVPYARRTLRPDLCHRYPHPMIRLCAAALLVACSGSAPEQSARAERPESTEETPELTTPEEAPEIAEESAMEQEPETDEPSNLDMSVLRIRLALERSSIPANVGHGEPRRSTRHRQALPLQQRRVGSDRGLCHAHDLRAHLDADA